MSRHKNDGKGRLGGHQAGTPNRATATTREWIQQLLEENQDSIREDLKKMSAKDRVNALLSLIPYVTPKQMATTANVSIERMSDDQLQLMASLILKNITDDEDNIDETR
jgi:hypothetical protein